MNRHIIIAAITGLILCSAPPSYAQTTGAAADPVVQMVQKMKPEDREKFALQIMHNNPKVTPDQIKDFKESYEKMSPDQQQQAVVEIGRPIFEQSIHQIDQARAQAAASQAKPQH